MTESSDLMRIAADAAGVGIVVVDSGGRILSVNPVGAHLLGWDVEHLVGRDEHDTFHGGTVDGCAGSDGSGCRIREVARRQVDDRADDATLRRRDGVALPVWWVATPLPAAGPAGRAAAVVVFADASERRARDVRLGHRLADAELRRAEAESAARAAIGAAKTETARLSTLAALSDLLAELDVVAGLDNITELVTESLADVCVIDRIDADNVVLRASVGATQPADPSWSVVRRMPMLSASSSGSLARILTGRSSEEVLTFSPTPQPRPRRPDGLDEAQYELFDEIGARHALVVPLRVARRILGAMTWVRRDLDAVFGAPDLLMAKLFALRIGQWLENLRLNEVGQTAALTLQRNLLTDAPEPDHLEIAVRYLPAAEGVEVGGDWYDALMSYDGHTVLAIGDVTGHDIAAAAQMAQLRSVLRFAALPRPTDPAGVLRAVDQAVPALSITALASAVVGAIDQDAAGRRSFVWSNAGHLPPVVLRADGTAMLLEHRPELLLGVDPDTDRSNHRVELPEGSTLLLYTDGLVERRFEALADGLARLAAVASGLADLPLEDFCDAVVKAMTADVAPSDDIALIAVRLHPET